jgi:hypothetical protein
MIENPLSPSHAPLNHCPAPLVPIMLETLGEDASTLTEGIHEKAVQLNGSDYDQLLVLYYNTFGSPFSCQDPQKHVTYTLSFVDQPAVLQQTVSNEARHYTVHVKLMKLPTVPGSADRPN